MTTTASSGGVKLLVDAKAGRISRELFVNEDIYVVRLDLWDVAQQAIIWQGNTVSFNTGGFKGLEKGGDHYAKTITDAIEDANIF